MNGEIVVVGSSNTDMVVKTSKLPVPGETILGGSFFMNPGGKGANQAVAAARLGGKLIFVARVGNDIFGALTKELLEKENIDCRYLLTDATEPSGVALITVDEKGENCIVVAPGSNNRLSAEDALLSLPAIQQADILLMQLETPIDTVCRVAETAFKMQKCVILNPAPACQLPETLYRTIFLITPNESEAELLTGIRVSDEQTAQKAAEVLRQKGVRQVIITMGSRGAFLHTSEGGRMFPAIKVQAVDTTAAGDVFNGALAAALASGRSIEEAIVFGNKAAAISVTRLGAQASAPYLHEIK